MFEKLAELITEGEIQKALYEFQDEYLHIQEMLPSDASKLCVLEASIWEALNDGTAELKALYKGLNYDHTNYEIYYMLGLYYTNINVNWAYLCMEMALDHCTNEEDANVIRSSFDGLKNSPGLRVRGTTVMVLSYNDKDIIKKCLESVENYSPSASTEVVVVDNSSTEKEVIDYLKEIEAGTISYKLPIKITFSPENLGFPKGCNIGADKADRDNDIFFLNNDAILTPLALFWLRMGLYDNRNVGAVSSFSNSASLQEIDQKDLERFVTDSVELQNEKEIILKALQNDDGKPWHKAVGPDIAYEAFSKYSLSKEIEYKNPYIKTFRLTGFALLVGRNALDAVSIEGKVFDEVFSPGYFEDDDLGIRLACAGYEQYICKNSFIYHNGGGGFEGHADAMERGREKFEEKWGFDIWGFSLPWQSACDEVIRLSRLNKGILKVLDFSCGLGANASYIKSIEPDVYIAGVCPNSFAAAVAGRIADATAFGEANTTRLPWADHSFDVVIAEKTFVSKGQIGRFLKPSGVSINEDVFPL